MEQTLKTNWKKLSREERGKLLAKSTRIVKTPQGWRVTSQTNTSRDYIVRFTRDEPKCSCPDCELRHKKCKHIYAVEFYIKKQIAQFNEMLIKVLAHNVCVVIQEVNELGVKAEFNLEQTKEI